MRFDRLFFAWISALTVVAPHQAVLAQSPPPSPPATAASRRETLERHVLATQGEDLVVDLAAADGVYPGTVLQLWRPIELRHPVTRKKLTDRFLIGNVELSQVRGVLSLGRVKGDVLREPEVGDVVTTVRLLLPEEPHTGDESPAATQPAPTGRSAETDPDAAAVTALFDSLAGASVVERIQAYEAYAEGHPKSRFCVVLQEEALALRRLITLHARVEREDAAGSIHLDQGTPPTHALAGTPISIGVDIEGSATGAVLHTRHAGEVTYASTPMAPAGKGYFVATVPGDRVVAPALELFIEATTEDGSAVAVVASPDAPWRTRVDRIPTPTPPVEHRTRVSILTDYADYNRLRGDDRVWQTEGTVGLRFRDVGVRALRTGFGVYRGVGGSLQELDELDLEPRRIGLTYGYLEGEVAFTRSWAVIGRSVLGLGDAGMAGGAQLHLRIGVDTGTNLTIGGEVLGGIGLRGITQLSLEPEGRFPIVLRSEVTNQPAGSVARGRALPGTTQQTTGRSDVGIRVIAQAGYRVVEPLVVSIRGSYQGRTINHAGPGVGGAVTYSW